MEECNLKGCRVGIAVVEDERDLLKLYQLAFKRWGVELCFVAHNGLEAIQKFIECSPKPHIIIMDHRMPMMSGIEATREILKLDPDVKIIFLSADLDCKNEAMKAGAFAFLSKPTSLNDITIAVAAAYRGGRPSVSR